MLSLLIVGLASNFWLALSGRVLGGFLNGTIGIVQTMVGELVTNPEHERTYDSFWSPALWSLAACIITRLVSTPSLKFAARAYAVMPFVWSVGTIVGPAIGGMLANPSATYPSIFPPSTLFDTSPYLLPNLVCAGLVAVSLVIGHLFLQETHPELRPGIKESPRLDRDAETAIMATSGATGNAGADLRAESYGTFNAVDIRRTESWHVNSDGSKRDPLLEAREFKVAFNRRVMMLVVALAIFTYHSMTYDHLLPIFLEDDRSEVTPSSPVPVTATSTSRPSLVVSGGLGLSTNAVGRIMAINGVIALIIQGIVFPPVAKNLGVWRVFLLTAIFHPLAYVVVPFLTRLPPAWLGPGIYACLTLRNLFSIMAYPVILILLKEASPSHAMLAKINGLAASAGAVCRTIAPPVAGYLYSIGARRGLTGLAWWGSALAALVGSIQCFFVERDKYQKARVQSAASGFPCHASTSVQPKREIIRITVDDLDP